MSALRALQPQTPPPSHMTAEQTLRAELRAFLREFLRSVPESEPDAVLELQMPDGQIRRVSRGALAERIRWLRPRQRRIVARQIVGHIDRGLVAKELGVCLKTIERDQAEALDILLEEAR